MATQYDEMWSKLGLDLAGHDQLLQVLGQGYQDVFLSQANRPQGMEYFNFVMSEVHGLRVKELVDGQAQGHKVVGSFCVFVPEEIVRAADATLVGLCTGADFAPEEVDKILPRNTCALIKSAFGFKLGKVCPFLEASDMIVGENTCDGKKKSYETLDGLVPNLYVMDIPQVKSEQGRQLLKTEFLRFMKAIEELTGNKLDVDSLKKGIKIVNEKRGALQRMYKLRKANPAPISGLDALLMSQVQFYDDPIRFTENVNSICDEMEKRIADGVGAVNADAPRVLLAGCPMAVPNWKVPHIIEQAGAVIVGEESCVGERGMRNLVDDSADSVEGLVEAIVDRYFKIDCAVFSPNPDRLEHIKQMAADYNAQGVIQYGLQFCQPYQMEAIGVEQNIKEGGMPIMRLETDYSPEDAGQLQTRVEAFLEMLS